MAKAGRPTVYSEEIINITSDYIKNHDKYGDTVPSVAGLSIVLDLNRDTLYDWAKQEDKKVFSDMLKKILSTQENKLINKGLKGEYNASITKLMLAKHGYVEKSEVDQNIKGDVTFINDVPRPDKDAD